MFQQDVGERQVPEEEGNGRQAGGQHTGVSDQSMILPGIGQHVAPTGDRLADAEAEEGAGHFGEDVAWNEDGGLGENDAPGKGKDVAAHAPFSGGSILRACPCIA